MDYYKAFPYYMGYCDAPYNSMPYSGTSYSGAPYQGYGGWNQEAVRQPMMLPEDRILEDMEYLQQMYPTYAKNYQGVISSVADKMDYEGSFIYDQYPDKLSIQRMVASVMAVIKANEDKENGGMEMGSEQAEGVEVVVTANTLTERAPWGEKEPWIRELVTVLMYYEILARRKRRQKKYWTM